MSKSNKPGDPRVHPGEILREDYFPDYNLSAYRLAKALKVPRSRVEAIIRGERAITADTALRLGRYFNTTAQMWMNLQTRYDLLTAQMKHVDELEKIEPWAA